ncbi:hypothetical protein [Methyloterricola oryzae]|uniref:hypothetical protein n=1 Tax=Methyloterricola oryzae TaxID=1495050 RepID=UPI0005EB7F64|nr:hypothetical protein [Methyloterricola oryzae]
MKKIIIAVLTSTLLGACSGGPEQVSLKEALVAKLKDDSDLKDYKIEPAEVADCVVKAITDSLPGFPGDPKRAKYYEAYAKFVAVKSPTDAENATNEYKDLFGSVIQAREAAVGVTDHIMGCMGIAIEQHAGEQ